MREIYIFWWLITVYLTGFFVICWDLIISSTMLNKERLRDYLANILIASIWPLIIPIVAFITIFERVKHSSN